MDKEIEEINQLAERGRWVAAEQKNYELRDIFETIQWFIINIQKEGDQHQGRKK